MLPFICEAAVRHGLRIALFGASSGVAEKMKENLLVRYPELKISFVRSGFFASPADEESAVRSLAASGSDITLVAMGVPRQELFIRRYFDLMNTSVAIGVGGLFDFYSGRIKRAPQWLRDCGLEWTFRLAMEPARMFRRYVLGNPLFLWRVWRSRD